MTGAKGGDKRSVDLGGICALFYTELCCKDHRDFSRVSQIPPKVEWTVLSWINSVDDDEGTRESRTHQFQFKGHWRGASQHLYKPGQLTSICTCLLASLQARLRWNTHLHIWISLPVVKQVRFVDVYRRLLSCVCVPCHDIFLVCAGQGLGRGVYKLLF